MLEKLKAQQTVIPAAAAAAGAGDARKVALKLPRAPPCFTEAIKLTGAAVGWGTPGEPGAKPLISGVNLVIRRGQRVLVGEGEKVAKRWGEWSWSCTVHEAIVDCVGVCLQICCGCQCGHTFTELPRATPLACLTNALPLPPSLHPLHRYFSISNLTNPPPPRPAPICLCRCWAPTARASPRCSRRWRATCRCGRATGCWARACGWRCSARTWRRWAAHGRRVCVCVCGGGGVERRKVWRAALRGSALGP